MNQNINVDIFDSVTPTRGEFFNFKEIGDAVQGTYVDKREGIDGYGNDRYIYVLRQNTGGEEKFINIGINKTNKFLHEKMDAVRLGQIVGFKLTRRVKSKRFPDGKLANVIEIFADPRIVDHEWLDEQRKIQEQFADVPSVTLKSTESPSHDGGNDVGRPIVTAASMPRTQVTVPADGRPLVGGVPVVIEPEEETISFESLKAIRALARSKNLTNDNMTDAQCDEAIFSFTRLPYSAENLGEIIMKISGHRG